MKFRELIETEPKTLFNKILILLIFVFILTGTDLIVKQIAFKNLQNKQDVVVIPGFWSFHYVVNDDIGFSILRGLNKFLDKNQKWIFLVILQGTGTLLVIIFYFTSFKMKYLIPLALISSGALGNVTDRIIRGSVVDYVMWFFNFMPDHIFGIPFKPFPIFNLADVYTVIGASMLLIVIFIFSKDIDFQKKEEALTDTQPNDKKQ